MKDDVPQYTVTEMDYVYLLSTEGVELLALFRTKEEGIAFLEKFGFDVLERDGDEPYCRVPEEDMTKSGLLEQYYLCCSKPTIWLGLTRIKMGQQLVFFHDE